MLQRSGRAIGFIEPCLPSPAKQPPTGADWLHEIKHDGFRIMALQDTAGVRLFTRGGHDFTARFPLIVAAVTALPVRSCFIDGEAIVSDESGLAVFDLMRRRRSGLQVVLCAFDLLQLDDEEVRRLPIEERKRMLARLLRKPSRGIARNKHYIGNGDIVYRQACRFGCEGIVSKRFGSTYRSGRSKHWLKILWGGWTARGRGTHSRRSVQRHQWSATCRNLLKRVGPSPPSNRIAR
jgi:bifunctional non-homologous end joining protein LigD